MNKKADLNKSEAKNYFAHWIQELEEKIKKGHPDSEKYAEQVAYLSLAMENFEADSSEGMYLK